MLARFSYTCGVVIGTEPLASGDGSTDSTGSRICNLVRLASNADPGIYLCSTVLGYHGAALGARNPDGRFDQTLSIPHNSIMAPAKTNASHRLVAKATSWPVRRINLVKLSVLSLIFAKIKILNSVVLMVFVYVVNALSRKEWSPNVLGHDNPSPCDLSVFTGIGMTSYVEEFSFHRG
jgi:hypothetical protein